MSASFMNSPSVKSMSVVAVIFMKNFAYISFSSIFLYLLRIKYGFDTDEAVSYCLILESISTVFPLFFCIFTDAKMGNFWALHICMLLYLAGYICISLASFFELYSFSLPLLVFAVFILYAPFGGSLDPILNVFGAEQLENSEVGEEEKQSYWTKNFYLGTVGNMLGNVFAGTIVINSIKEVAGLDDVRESSYDSNNINIALVGIVVLTCLVLLCFRNYYVRPIVEKENKLLKTLTAFITICRNSGIRGNFVLFGFAVFCLKIISNTAITFISSVQHGWFIFDILSISVTLISAIGIVLLCQNPQFIVSNGSKMNVPQDTMVDAFIFTRILPLALFSPILCGSGMMILAQVLISSACQANLIVFGSAQFSANLLACIDTIFIILITPFVDPYIYPFLDKIRGAKVSSVEKIGLGCTVMVLALLSGGILETFRKQSDLLINEPYSVCAPSHTYMSNISILWYFIPFFLSGISQILFAPTVLALLFDEVPESFRTMNMALGCFVYGVAACVVQSCVKLASAWLPNDLNEGKLDYFLYIAAAVIGFGFLLFYFLLVKNFRLISEIKITKLSDGKLIIEYKKKSKSFDCAVEPLLEPLVGENLNYETYDEKDEHRQFFRKRSKSANFFAELDPSIELGSVIQNDHLIRRSKSSTALRERNR